LNDLLAAALLGLIQGVTEFLPISSTAHLALAEKVLRLDPARYGLTFTVALHMGTLLAVLLYYSRVWVGLITDLLRGRFVLPLQLAIATVPAVIAALVFGDLIAGPLREPLSIASGLVVGSGVFLIAERLATDRRETTTLGDAAAVGVAQALALIPGMSRSGLTISMGLARGLRRAEATRLSFLLSTPAVFGAGLKTALDARKAPAVFDHPDALVVGFLVSFVSGLAAIAFLVRFLRGHSLGWFVPYRLALAGIIVAAVTAGAL